MNHTFAPILERIQKARNVVDINDVVRALARVTNLDEAPLASRRQVGNSIRNKVAEVATLAVARRDYANRFGDVFDASAYDTLIARLGLARRRVSPAKIPHLPPAYTRVPGNGWRRTAPAT